MKRLPVYLIILIFLIAFSDPKAVITGKITTREGKPLVRGVVEIGGEYDFTDLKGNYRIKDVPYGNQILLVISSGDTLRKIRTRVEKPHHRISVSVP